MSKKGSLISSPETGIQYTDVDSKAYGKHTRAKRGTYTPLVVTDTMKKAGELMRSANECAKVIFDALKPFCSDVKDSKMWSRLVAGFRRQLQYDDLDLTAVFESFYFHPRRPLFGVLSHNLEVTQSEGAEKSLVLKVNSKSTVKPRRNHPDRYEQIIIAVFLDANFRATVLSDSKVHPVAPDKHNEHIATFPCPAGAETVIIVMKCTHQFQGRRSPGVASGMSVVKLVLLKTT